ncbi:hypothetical protein [Micromonospora parastrephiae]|uniref:hypothetical protein n=1 Tax=Micromonospora parastrephiae TaxID=2806101 RepID=UPI00281511ED|nr:hypothetical protein [Micromonospora parastrephiae]
MLGVPRDDLDAPDRSAVLLLGLDLDDLTAAGPGKRDLAGPLLIDPVDRRRAGVDGVALDGVALELGAAVVPRVALSSGASVAVGATVAAASVVPPARDSSAAFTPTATPATASTVAPPTDARSRELRFIVSTFPRL